MSILYHLSYDRLVFLCIVHCLSMFVAWGSNPCREIPACLIIKLEQGLCSHTKWHIRKVHGCRQSERTHPFSYPIATHHPDMAICMGALTLFYLFPATSTCIPVQISSWLGMIKHNLMYCISYILNNNKDTK